MDTARFEFGGPLVAAWGIVRALGRTVFAALAEFCARSTDALLGQVGEIEGREWSETRRPSFCRGAGRQSPGGPSR
ncbi:hypothetical protein ACFY5D_04125 [Paeniglutamicibacter sp. NPDC012692]|uniref:hypothetical protein n=1 Tax=Paeniglutamicibacter sp. NPDC012692 TaxID=3364388 RepID=UPI0036C429B4